MKFELVENNTGESVKCPVCGRSIPAREFFYRVERGPEADEVTEKQKKWLQKITDDRVNDQFEFFMCEECGSGEDASLVKSKGKIDGKDPISYLDGDKWLERKIEEYKKS